MKKFFVYMIMTTMAAGALLLQSEKMEKQEELAGKILRFHVLANSDSTMDQELKLKVRDSVGGFMADRLSDVDGLEESEEIAKRYRIFSVPTVVCFKGGKKIDSIVGLNSYDDMLSFILRCDKV